MPPIKGANWTPSAIAARVQTEIGRFRAMSSFRSGVSGGMTYVLHYAPDNASLIIRLALTQAGLGFETRLVDRSARAQCSDAYRSLNPAGLIPTLETPDGPLSETGAILLWLADRHGTLGPGPTASGRAGYLKWLFYTSNTLHPALRMMFYPAQYIGPGAADHLRLRTGLQAPLKEALGLLDTVAAAQPSWLGQVDPTGLDFYIACCLRWCALYPAEGDRSWFDLETYPALYDLCGRLERLPAVTAAITAEGLGPHPFTHPQYATPPEGSAT